MASSSVDEEAPPPPPPVRGGSFINFPRPSSAKVKAVKWETTPETGNNHKYINGKLYSRLVFPTDVEIAARFALTVSIPTLHKK